MAHSNDDNEDEQTLRSIRDDSFALVTFESKTLRNIDVFWMDYNGDRVKYTTIGPNVTFFIQTYETHPWIFRDEESGAVLLADGRDVFFPQPYDGREQPHVNIHIPGLYLDFIFTNLDQTSSLKIINVI
jgi:von Hippel-Lindau disease tumor supressor